MRKKNGTRSNKPRQNPGVLNPRQCPAVLEDGRGSTSQQPKCYGACGSRNNTAQDHKTTIN